MEKNYGTVRSGEVRWGNNLVGIVWGWVSKRPFQLRRNRQSVRHRAQAPQELWSIGLGHRQSDLYPAPLRDQISATKYTKSLTARSRLSNHERGNTVSRNSATRLSSTPPMRKAASVASKDLRQKVSKLKASFNSLMRFSPSALAASIRVTNRISLPYIANGDFELRLPRQVLLSEASFIYAGQSLVVQLLGEDRLSAPVDMRGGPPVRS